MEVLKRINSPEFLSGGGEMGERIRHFDWNTTPLGDPEQWEQSLKTCVRIMLTSPHPMFVWWGDELINIYNDAYRFVLGEKHPDALGRPGNEVWKEIWHEVWKRGEIVFTKNEGTFDDGLLLVMNRFGYLEETYFKFSYNPIPGDNGGTKGLFCACTEETERIVNDRSLETLAKLSAYAIGCQYESEVFEKAASALETNLHDFPFTLLYKIGHETSTAILCATSGIEKGHPAAPQIIDLNGDVDTWPIREALMENKPLMVHDLQEKLGSLPKGTWDISPSKAVILPVLLKGELSPSAILIAGLNPYRKLDDKYRGLILLVIEQLSQALLNVGIIETERKRVEAIEELDKAKTLFFSNISHEFRTPITLMLGPLEELLTKPSFHLNQPERTSLEAAHRNALRLLKLVNALLDFNMIESGKKQASFKPTDLNTYTINLASNFRSAIEKAGLQFVIDDHPLSQPVYLDMHMWEKVVFNLLSNAFKYTLSGSITVRLFENDHEAVLEVMDTGSGIPKKDLPHMFERFHRVENATGRTHEGSGIGLSLTKELIKMHGGTIEVQSEEGKGSCFTVRIPFGKDHLSGDKIEDADPDYEEIISRGYPGDASLLDYMQEEIEGESSLTVVDEELPTIMIVDDNADLRQHIKQLIGTKYKTVTAANGLDALHKINQKLPSLILSDIMMPVMDGIELLHHVKGNKRMANVPVILITARAGEESRVEGYETGADDYLVKPFSVKELMSRIQSQLRLVTTRNRIEKQLRDFFMQTPIAIAVLRGENFVVELANRRVLEFWDRKESDVLDKPIFEALGEVAGQGLEGLLTDVLRTGLRYVDEERAIEILRNNKLTKVYVKFIYEPLLDEDGTVSGIIVMVDEITAQVMARKEMEKNAFELQQVNRDLKIAATLTQSIADAVIGTDMNYNIISWNHGAEKLYGYTEAEVLGKFGRDIVKTRFLNESDKVDWQEKLDSVGWWQGEVIHHRKDGSPVPVMVSLAYVKDSEGKPIAAVGVNRDITEQKAFAQRLEEMVKERTAELNRTNEELKSFNYIASHDLQEPLRKIQIFIDLLQRHREDPNSLDQYLAKIKESSRRMSQLIQSVLEYSRLSYSDDAYQKTDLNRILTDVLTDYELIIQEKKAVITNQKLPTIRAIPYQMHQLFANLIGNSLKFNTQRPEIVISAKIVTQSEIPVRKDEKGDRPFVQLTFSDNGIGFEGEYSEKIMQLFQRLHNKTEYPGSGVGLSIVKKIVDHHQGLIRAQSEKNKGATFTVWLPV